MKKIVLEVISKPHFGRHPERSEGSQYLTSSGHSAIPRPCGPRDDKNGVLKCALVIIVCCLCLVLSKISHAQEQNAQITVNGSSLEIGRGDNKFVAEIGSDYRENLRIYGVNDVQRNVTISTNDPELQRLSPLAYATYGLVASPFTGNTEDCERNDAQNSAVLIVIVDSKDVMKEIDRLNGMHGRRRATLIGKNVEIKEFHFKGKDYSSFLQPQGRIDPRRAILITDIMGIEE